MLNHQSEGTTELLPLPRPAPLCSPPRCVTLCLPGRKRHGTVDLTLTGLLRKKKAILFNLIIIYLFILVYSCEQKYERGLGFDPWRFSPRTPEQLRLRVYIVRYI